MRIQDRWAGHGSGRRAAPAALALLGLFVVGGCVDARSRPSLTGVESTDGGGGAAGRSEVSVELVSPDGSQAYFILGREMEIRVRATDGAGRLEGLGYEVRRSGFLRTIQEEEAVFSTRSSAEQTFRYVPPDTLPNPTQILIRGYAFDDRQIHAFSDFVEVQLIFCPANATWC